MTRLEILCELHNRKGGTIHDFNKMYGIDFTLATESELHRHARVLIDSGKFDLARNIVKIPLMENGIIVV